MSERHMFQTITLQYGALTERERNMLKVAFEMGKNIPDVPLVLKTKNEVPTIIHWNFNRYILDNSKEKSIKQTAKNREKKN